jgi:hypothetical protein
MKVLKAQKIFSGSAYPHLTMISDCLDKKGKRYKINSFNWDGYSHEPEIEFNIGYNEKEIFLKYYVKEDCVKSGKTLSNQKVFEDSCVEFFVSPGDDGVYYNFEFNCIGTCLLGVGAGRGNRILAGEDIISKIRRLPSMGTLPFKEKKGEYFWTLTVAVPLEVFFHHEIKDLKNKSFKANFYKCGDKLSTPHYITWNPVQTEKPDFHQPEFFGKIRFV